MARQSSYTEPRREIKTKLAVSVPLGTELSILKTDVSLSKFMVASFSKATFLRQPWVIHCAQTFLRFVSFFFICAFFALA